MAPPHRWPLAGVAATPPPPRVLLASATAAPELPPPPVGVRVPTRQAVNLLVAGNGGEVDPQGLGGGIGGWRSWGLGGGLFPAVFSLGRTFFLALCFRGVAVGGGEGGKRRSGGGARPA